jgi:hypothetical protein
LLSRCSNWRKIAHSTSCGLRWAKEPQPRGGSLEYYWWELQPRGVASKLPMTDLTSSVLYLYYLQYPFIWTNALLQGLYATLHTTVQGIPTNQIARSKTSGKLNHAVVSPLCTTKAENLTHTVYPMAASISNCSEAPIKCLALRIARRTRQFSASFSGRLAK